MPLRELNYIVERRGAPLLVVSDNGTELTSHVVLSWQQDRGVGWHYIAPGQASAERLRREPERSLARRMPQ